MSTTYERVREVFAYDPETATVTWLVATSNRVKVGDRAGSLNNGGDGYRRICIDGRGYLEHRLIWRWMTGSWPAAQIDHINGDRSDNRWANLREATNAQNLANRGANKNNTSGFKGVSRFRQRWQASITKDGRQIHSVYDTPEAAHAAYVAAANELHGEFARVK